MCQCACTAMELMRGGVEDVRGHVYRKETMPTTPAPVLAALTGAVDVDAAAGELFDAARALGRSGTATGEAWMTVLAQCASAKARLEATQTLAVAHVAAIDVVDAGCDDGTLVEQHRGLGHIRFDAPELVAPTLGLTPSGAEPRVRQAVSLMTRTPALLLAMADGRGNAYRAGIIADELAEAPAADARAVVAAVGDRFGHDAGGRLGSRVRRELNRVNPDVVQRQCLKARSNTGLRRWVNGDGTDTWQVEVPTETSRAAYAAVNDLALKVKKDTGVNIGSARAIAMFQLILGRATGTYQVHVGIPMSVLADAAVEVEEAKDGDEPPF